jgi:hypothetical protein
MRGDLLPLPKMKTALFVPTAHDRPSSLLELGVPFGPLSRCRPHGLTSNEQASRRLETSEKFRMYPVPIPRGLIGMTSLMATALWDCERPEHHYEPSAETSVLSEILYDQQRQLLLPIMTIEARRLCRSDGGKVSYESPAIRASTIL